MSYFIIFRQKQELLKICVNNNYCLLEGFGYKNQNVLTIVTAFFVDPVLVDFKGLYRDKPLQK